MSHPVWVRGLKLCMIILLVVKKRVAPRVGAWIETHMEAEKIIKEKSHPVWVRGLKQEHEAV